jgi:hypothetical protein
MSDELTGLIDPALCTVDLRDVPLEVFCDEAGHTGPFLLDAQQTLFAYASVAIGDAEAFTILERARRGHPVQMPELKASKLLKTPRGRDLVLDVLRAVRGRYSFVLHDKLLALCCKVFEYIYEPVFQDDPRLLYAKNLHRFVAMYCYVFFKGKAAGGGGVNEAEAAVRQFEWFMRTLDPAKAPLLFGDVAVGPVEDDPFRLILKFAQAHRELIVADNAEIATETPDGGKWTLDVAIASLFSLCNHWGRTGRPLAITCDDSKPLRATAHLLDGSATDPIILRAQAMMENRETLGWRMARPVSFGDSRDHPALQIADIVAGAGTAVASSPGDPALREITEALMPHLHPHTVMPDFEHADFSSNREAAVNWLILHHLAERAEQGADPREGLAEVYRAAEISWVKGEWAELNRGAG